MQPDYWRRLLAEVITTALLVFFGAGSFMAALSVDNGHLTYAGVGIISFAFALIVALNIYIFGPVSGAQFNPAVTISLAVVRRFPWRDVPLYIIAQAIGAVIGGLIACEVFGPDKAITLNISGGTQVQPGFTAIQAALAEFIGTFLLLLTIMATVIDKRAPQGWAGFLIGLEVGCEVMVIGPISNGSINPARTLGPYVATSIFGGTTPWDEYWIYLAGPILGAIAGCAVYEFVAQPARD